MTRWFISDTHFSHNNIIKLSDRPFADIRDMNETLIIHWNHHISFNDEVFFLGDFAFAPIEQQQAICEQLNGRKICIRGNHDKSPATLYEIGFNVVLESAFIKIGRHNVELIHIPSEIAPHHFQLHGHVHEKRPNHLVGTQLNLSVEVWDYKPVSEKKIISMLDKK
jgi:calcineurin-like phosphoesterase family protein